MFATFPEFTKLTLDHREEYEAFIKDHPPLHDTSFTGLMTWWNPFDNMAVSTLNGNLVVPYMLPGDERYCGLSVVGTKEVDQSLCTLFDYLREKGELLRLVNVPDCVVSQAAYPEMFLFKEQRALHEYILPIDGFYPIKNMTAYRRRKVESQLARAKGRTIVAKSLDLRVAENRKFLWDSAVRWQPRSINNYGRLEQDAMKICIDQAEKLNMENVCLFIDNELYGFCLYQIARDKRYVVVTHIKATHVSTLGFELIAYMFAKWFSEHGLLYVNVSGDYGLLRLRMFMLTLGPHNFFRKYTIEPA